MDRSVFGYLELLTADTTSPDSNDDKLNRSFDRVEASANERVLDLITRGVVTGLTVVQNGTPNMTVKVNVGVAYDQTGQRIEVPSQQTVDPLTDYQLNAIALPDSGKEKYSSIYLKFKRQNLESAQDGNSVQYYESELEYFELRVRGGAQANAGTATPRALQGDEILLADILLVNAMTTILDASIDMDTRRQTVVGVGAVDETNIQHTNGAELFADAIVPPADSDLRTWLRQLVTDLGKTTATAGAARIGNVAIGSWADSVLAASAGGIGGQLVAVITALASSAGTAKIGGAAISQSPTSLSAGTLLAQVTALLTAINARVTLAQLAASTGSALVGGAATSQSPTSLSADTVAAQLIALLTAINARARIASAETITAKYTFDLAAPGTGLETASDTTADLNGPVNLDGAVTQTAAFTKSGAGATTADRTNSINTSAVSDTLDVSYDYHYVDGPAPAGNIATYTIKSTSPAPPANAMMEFTCFAIGINDIRLEREGGQRIVRFTGAPNWGSAKLRFIGGSWRLADVAGAYDTATWNP